MKLLSTSLVLLLFSSAGLLGDPGQPLLPVETGTTWSYVVLDEAAGTTPSHRATVVRVAGPVEQDGKQLLRFETLQDNDIQKVELLEVTDHSIVCYARGRSSDTPAKLDRPEPIIGAALKSGATWDTDGIIADVQTHQHWVVAGEEDVFVPAAKFHAFHLHCDGRALVSVVVDRWLLPGVGFIKEVITMRGPGGTLLQRTTTELQKRPEVIPLPTATPTATPEAIAILPLAPSEESVAPEEPQAYEAATPTPGSPEVSVPSTRKRLIVEVSDDPNGGLKTSFNSDVKNIYVRWHGHDLPEGARVRLAWVAVDVGDIVDPNFIVDQTETVAPAPDSSARFTLGRPPDGWAAGKYRVDFFINDALELSVPVTITE